MSDLKDVVITGAGLSHPFGVPIGEGLTLGLLNFLKTNRAKIQERAGYEAYELVHQYREIASMLFPPDEKEHSENIRFEEFLSELVSYKEMRQIATEVIIGETKSTYLSSLHNRLLRMLCLYLDVESRRAKDERVTFESLISLCKFFGRDCRFINFNYDLVLEYGLMVAFGGVNRGDIFPLSPAVYKPHGSIDIWNIRENFSKLAAGLRELPDFAEEPGDRICRIARFEDWMASSDPGPYVESEDYPMIVPPTYSKSYKSKYIQSQIRGAYEAIVRAEKIFIIGFSFNEYDRQIRSLLRYAFIIRKQVWKKDKPKIILIDPNPERAKDALWREYRISPEIHGVKWNEWKWN